MSSLTLSLSQSGFAGFGSLVVAPGSTAATRLTQAELDDTVAAAVAQWDALGLSASQSAQLHSAHFTVGDFTGIVSINGVTGATASAGVLIDDDAAGHGWFVDQTPGDNSEFTAQNIPATRFLADASSAASGHLDLLTVVNHELGRLLGLDSSTSAGDTNDLMYFFLEDGERRLPDASDVAHIGTSHSTDRGIFGAAALTASTTGGTITQTAAAAGGQIAAATATPTSISLTPETPREISTNASISTNPTAVSSGTVVATDQPADTMTLSAVEASREVFAALQPDASDPNSYIGPPQAQVHVDLLP